MPDGQRRFATTRWSLVIAAGSRAEPGAAAALAALCETYWFPVYAFVRRSGHSTQDAQDLTQAFFARMIEKNDVGTADPARGRFRAFLLTSVRNFLANQRDAAAAQKRGGGAVHIPIEFDDGERRYRLELPDHETPERLYERRWALSTLAAAMNLVAAEYQAADRRGLFDHLKPFLAGVEPDSYVTLATELDTTEGALRVALHRLRRAYASALRSVVSETVESPSDVDEELRYLVRVVSG
jgi:DNA-directed RNA polymerase specialized sigma24 family protein